MVKKDLLDQIAKVTGSKKSAEGALNCILDQIKKGLKKDDSFQITGFGSFKTVKRAARKGRNPQTGEGIKIKASKSVKFSPSKNLKQSL